MAGLVLAIPFTTTFWLIIDAFFRDSREAGSRFH
jgi:hypothetical protein